MERVHGKGKTLGKPAVLAPSSRHCTYRAHFLYPGPVPLVVHKLGSTDVSLLGRVGARQRRVRRELGPGGKILKAGHNLAQVQIRLAERANFITAKTTYSGSHRSLSLESM